MQVTPSPSARAIVAVEPLTVRLPPFSVPGSTEQLRVLNVQFWGNVVSLTV